MGEIGALLGRIMNNLPDSLLLESLILGALATVLTAVIRIVWAGSSWLIERAVFLLSRSLTHHVIYLGPVEAFPPGIRFSVLIIRFGTDQYISTMASDRERLVGRLQLKIYPAEVRGKKDGAYLSFKVPVHKRLGSQFKVFADVEPGVDLEEIMQVFNANEEIHEVSISDSKFDRRIYFLLKDYAQTQTVDGPVNNFIYPV